MYGVGHEVNAEQAGARAWTVSGPVLPVDDHKPEQLQPRFKVMANPKPQACGWALSRATKLQGTVPEMHCSHNVESTVDTSEKTLG